jgi:TRAP-type C4-dicarboxylate transport system permease small subunit
VMDRALDRLISLAHLIARAGAWCGGLLLFGAAFLLGFEVVIRKVFSLSLGGANEFSTFAVAIGGAWALTFTLLERAHVRIESLYAVLPRRLGAVMDLLAHAVLTTVMALIAWYGWFVFQNSLVMGSRTLTPFPVPVAIPQFFWVAGLIFFVLVSLLLFARALIAWLKGDLAMVHRLLGPRGIALEIRQELGQAHERRIARGDGQ